MGTFSLIGDDTIQIGARILSDFGSGEIAKVTFPTELATVKTGKNGNTIYILNSSGFQASMELKVIRGSADDKFIQSLVTSYRSNPTGFVLQTVAIVKKIGDGSGKTGSDNYTMVGGVPTKNVEIIVNVEADTDQALSVYTWVFAGSDRALV